MVRLAQKIVVTFVLSLGAVGSLHATEPAQSAAPSSTAAEPRYAKLQFEELASFPFVSPPFDLKATPDAERLAIDRQIPGIIKRWQGKKVVVTGYMLPSRTQEGLVTEFMLMRDHVAIGNLNFPTINEWVIVRMKRGIVAETRQIPVAIRGEFKVGPIYQGGYLVGIYELEGDGIGDGRR